MSSYNEPVEEGPHPSQVQRRKPAYRVAQLVAVALPPSADIPPLENPHEVLLRGQGLRERGGVHAHRQLPLS